MTDGGFAKRTRTNEYRLTNRGAKGVKAMSLANQERGVLVGAFIVEDGDEVMSITQGGQVVRSRIDENFRVLGRSTMGVKFVTPKDGDAVAVVARSVEAKVEDEIEAAEAAGEQAGDRRRRWRSRRRRRTLQTPPRWLLNRRMSRRMQQSRVMTRRSDAAVRRRTDLDTALDRRGM